MASSFTRLLRLLTPDLSAGQLRAWFYLQLDGVWTDVAIDLIRDNPKWTRGINGRGPGDRVAAPGSLTCSLDNTSQNAAALADYYTPGHVNCRSGFREGIKVRLKLSNGAVTRVVWAGTIKSILPDPADVTGLRVSALLCETKFAVLAELDVSNLALMEDARADAMVQAIIDLMPEPPATTDLDPGIDEYPFVFDDLGGSTVKAMPVLQDIVQSGLEYFYERGDSAAGETFRLENRYTRALADSQATFTKADLPNTTDAIAVTSATDGLFNMIEVQTVPRRTDTDATTVLVQHTAAIAVDPVQTTRVFLDYRDPDNEAEYVGGKDIVTPEVTTDWTANSLEDGTGNDRASDVTVVATPFGSRVMLELSNAGTDTLYVRGPGAAVGIFVRGRGLYRYSALSSIGTNDTSIALFGSRPLPQPLLMPYQPNQTTGQGAADFSAVLYGGSSIPTQITVATETGGDLETHGIARDIGDRITLDDSITGIGDLDAFVHLLEQELDINNGARLYTTYGLAPASSAEVFAYDDPEMGQFDGPAGLGYL